MNSDFDVPYIKIDQKKISDPSIPTMLGLEIFILVKKWSQDPFFVVTRFVSILSKFSEFSTGHVFHLFKFVFFVVTYLVLLSKEKISKK